MNEQTDVRQLKEQHEWEMGRLQKRVEDAERVALDWRSKLTDSRLAERALREQNGRLLTTLMKAVWRSAALHEAVTSTLPEEVALFMPHGQLVRVARENAVRAVR